MVISVVNDKYNRQIALSEQATTAPASPAKLLPPPSATGPVTPKKGKKTLKRRKVRASARVIKRAARIKPHTFGSRLWKAIKHQHLTVSAVAKDAGITRQTLWRYMAGTTKANLVNVTALASALGVRFEWLATGNGAMFDTTGTRLHGNARARIAG